MATMIIVGVALGASTPVIVVLAGFMGGIAYAVAILLPGKLPEPVAPVRTERSIRRLLIIMVSLITIATAGVAFALAVFEPLYVVIVLGGLYLIWTAVAMPILLARDGRRRVRD